MAVHRPGCWYSRPPEIWLVTGYYSRKDHREEHEERHIQISFECSSIKTFSLTVTKKELEQLESGKGRLFKKLYSQTVREAVKSKDFDMDYAIYDEDMEKDIIGWRR